ncbi:hypothetical protein JW835_01060 [bacterium]|nr:hypothetical protein [bacterium]
MKERFGEDGRLIIPLNKRKRSKSKKNENKIRYVINEAYCPKGCNIMDSDHPVNGYPGLKIRFRRPDHEGIFIISAIEGDFDKIVLSGKLQMGVKDDLYCPYCDTLFERLTSCNCQPDADMVVVGLIPKLDFNNAITFCNVTGCGNGAFVKSGDILRHIRLQSL